MTPFYGGSLNKASNSSRYPVMSRNVARNVHQVGVLESTTPKSGGDVDEEGHEHVDHEPDHEHEGEDEHGEEQSAAGSGADGSTTKAMSMGDGSQAEEEDDGDSAAAAAMMQPRAAKPRLTKQEMADLFNYGPRDEILEVPLRYDIRVPEFNPRTNRAAQARRYRTSQMLCEREAARIEENSALTYRAEMEELRGMKKLFRKLRKEAIAAGKDPNEVHVTREMLYATRKAARMSKLSTTASVKELQQTTMNPAETTTSLATTSNPTTTTTTSTTTDSTPTLSTQITTGAVDLDEDITVTTGMPEDEPEYTTSFSSSAAPSTTPQTTPSSIDPKGSTVVSDSTYGASHYHTTSDPFVCPPRRDQWGEVGAGENASGNTETDDDDFLNRSKTVPRSTYVQPLIPVRETKSSKFRYLWNRKPKGLVLLFRPNHTEHDPATPTAGKDDHSSHPSLTGLKHSHRSHSSRRGIGHHDHHRRRKGHSRHHHRHRHVRKRKVIEKPPFVTASLHCNCNNNNYY